MKYQRSRRPSTRLGATDDLSQNRQSVVLEFAEILQMLLVQIFVDFYAALKPDPVVSVVEQIAELALQTDLVQEALDDKVQLGPGQKSYELQQREQCGFTEWHLIQISTFS